MPQASLRRRLAWIFVGSDGIRAGWSILLFLVVTAIPVVLIALTRHFLHFKPPATETTLYPWRLLFREAIGIAIIACATAVMARIEHRSVWSYGMAKARAGLKFLAGLAGGFLTLSLLIAGMAALGALAFDGVALHGANIAAFGTLWAAGFILVGVFEENLFRGYILTTLTRGIGFWPAALVSSAIFGLVHLQNKGETMFGILAVVAAGLLLCALLRLSGSLWLCIGFHGAWDWAQSFFYGTPDSGLLAARHFLLSHAAGDPRFSGGATGPEGSVLSGPVMVAGLLVMAGVGRVFFLKERSKELL